MNMSNIYEKIIESSKQVMKNTKSKLLTGLLFASLLGNSGCINKTINNEEIVPDTNITQITQTTNGDLETIAKNELNTLKSKELIQTLITQDFNINKGFNFLGVQVDENKKASDILNNKSVNAVYKWQPQTQDFEYLLKLPNSQLFGNDFDLQPGNGYIIKSNEDINISLNSDNTIEYTQNLVEGFNLVTFSENLDIQYAKDILNKGAESIFKWNKEKQEFDFLMDIGKENLFGTNFKLDPDTSYFVKTKKQISLEENKPPVIEYANIDNKITLGDKTNLNFKVTDDHQLKTIEVGLNGEIIKSYETSDKEYILNEELTFSNSGIQELNIKATDNNGKTTTKTLEILVEDKINNIPTITAQKSFEKEVGVTGEIKITGYDKDNDNLTISFEPEDPSINFKIEYDNETNEGVIKLKGNKAIDTKGTIKIEDGKGGIDSLIVDLSILTKPEILLSTNNYTTLTGQPKTIGIIINNAKYAELTNTNPTKINAGISKSDKNKYTMTVQPWEDGTYSIIIEASNNSINTTKEIQIIGQKLKLKYDLQLHVKAPDGLIYDGTKQTYSATEFKEMFKNTDYINRSTGTNSIELQDPTGKKTIEQFEINYHNLPIELQNKINENDPTGFGPFVNQDYTDNAYVAKMQLNIKRE